MKKSVFLFLLIMFSFCLCSQPDTLIGKWNILSMEAQGKYIAHEHLAMFGQENDYLQLLSDGTFAMIDQGKDKKGKWKYEERNTFLYLNLTFESTEAEESEDQELKSIQYTILELTDESLTLSRDGGLLRIEYRKAVE